MRKQYTKVQYDKHGNKQCTNCLKYKEVTEFHKYSKAPDLLKPWCKVCVREYDLLEGDPKRSMPRKMQGNKIHCRNCKQYLDKSKFKLKPIVNSQYVLKNHCEDCRIELQNRKTLKKHNMTLEQYLEIKKSQNNKCKLCENDESTYRNRLSVDHDHNCCSGEGSCGKCIRGLLCHKCNMALGAVNDNKALLQKMIEYLK